MYRKQSRKNSVEDNWLHPEEDLAGTKPTVGICVRAKEFVEFVVTRLYVL